MTSRPQIQAIQLMRRIDQYLGPPICFALAVLKSLAQTLRRPPVAPAAEIENVLVIKFWGMGSIVLATPALRALKKAYPRCRVTILTFEQNESICRMIQSIDEVVGYRADGLVPF